MTKYDDTFQNYKPNFESCPITGTNMNSEFNEQLTIEEAKEIRNSSTQVFSSRPN